jgi:hypothetical protein
LSHAKYRIFISFTLFDADWLPCWTPVVYLPIIQQPAVSINLKKPALH